MELLDKLGPSYPILVPCRTDFLEIILKASWAIWGGQNRSRPMIVKLSGPMKIDFEVGFSFLVPYRCGFKIWTLVLIIVSEISLGLSLEFLGSLVALLGSVKPNEHDELFFVGDNVVGAVVEDTVDADVRTTLSFSFFRDCRRQRRQCSRRHA